MGGRKLTETKLGRIPKKIHTQKNMPTAEMGPSLIFILFFHPMCFYLKLSEVEQARELERTPFVVVDSRAKEVESEGGRHGAEQLQTD